MTTALIIVVLLCAVSGLALAAKRFNVPYPVAFVIGGAGLAFIPNLPRITIDPNWIFLLILPPLLFSAGWGTDWIDFKRNRRPIALLAIGLVIFTTVVVALVAHALIPNLPWALAFTLGAIISPTDTMASEAIMSRLTVPRRIATIITGESLVNDASALVIYRFALAAALTGVFEAWHAVGAFFIVSIGGIAVGLAIAFALEFVLRFIQKTGLADSTIINVVTLIAPYAAYLPAEALHVSGVLATVTAGVYAGRRSAFIVDSEARLVGGSVWEVLEFLLNGFAFVLIGLELPAIARGLTGSVQHYIFDAVVVSVVVILVRIAWVFPATYLPRWLSATLRKNDPSPPWRAVAVISWTGMRGILSLAAALALPYANRMGIPLPARNEIIFITFGVIFATLIVQGFTLGPLIEWLGVAETSSRERQEAEVRIRALEAGLQRLHDLEKTFTSAQHWETAGRLLAEYEQRINHLRGHFSDDGQPEQAEAMLDHELQAEALKAEREAIARLRSGGEIPDEIFRNVQYDLDLAEVRLS